MKKNKSKKIIKILIILFVIISIIGVVGTINKDNKGNQMTQAYTMVEVEKGDIIKSLSGSGTLKPAHSYTIMTLVKGDILSADFEEGDIVDKDEVLYEIDSSDVSNNIEKVEISLGQAERNYNNVLKRQNIESPINGRVCNFNVSIGDEISQGETIATIRNSDVMTLKIPFLSVDTEMLHIGQEGIITLDKTFETLRGVITEISKTDIVGMGNMITRMVTFEVSNSGGINNTMIATATVGDIYCAGSGTFNYKSEEIVVSATSGTVVSKYVSEGDFVEKDAILLKIGGDIIEEQIISAEESLRNAEISLDSAKEQLDNYYVTSPISGTIVDKQYKVGDTVESGKQLCTIYDLSYLEMVLNIDELDISAVKENQEVVIVADAMPEKEYRGKITKVSVAAQTVNGTTSYPVTIRLDDTEGLLPGMNVNADIVVAEIKGVLTIPNEAVERGNVVLITEDSPSAANKIDKESPEGYVYVEVEVGLSDDDNVEIVSGLQENDVVAYISKSSSSIFNLIMAGNPQGGEPPMPGRP